MPSQDFDSLTKSSHRLLKGLMIMQSDEDGMGFSVCGREYELDFSPREFAERIIPASLLLAQFYARQYLLKDFNLKPMVDLFEDEMGGTQFSIDVRARSEAVELPQFSLIAPFILHVFDTLVLRKDLRYNLEKLDMMVVSAYENDLELAPGSKLEAEQEPEPDTDGMSLGM